MTSLEGREDYAGQVGSDAVHPGDLIVIKFWAPWCRSCKNFEPKYKHIATQYKGVRFLELNWEENREFCHELGVMALPMIKMYTHEGEVESFACGPKKVELLRSKLDDWKTRVNVAAAAVADTATAAAGDGSHAVRPGSPGPRGSAGQGPAASTTMETEEAAEVAAAAAAAAAVSVATVEPSSLRTMCRPLFGNLTDAQAESLIERAVKATYSEGQLIVEQGDVGRRFFVLLKGEVDVFRQSGYGGFAEHTPWGEPINRLKPGQYFGEHALLTGKPRMASVAAATDKVTCLAIEQSVLEDVDPDHWLQQ